MADSRLAELMFPAALRAPAEWEAEFPRRDVPETAFVTRFAPSPTGYLHIGGLYTAIVARDLAHQTDGRFFIRIENTDSARESADALRQFDIAFDYFAITSDDAADPRWGPYRQSERADIYESFARSLVEQGKAYPCFCTSEELEAQANAQRAAKIPPGYYGKWATCRHLSEEEATAKLEAGTPFVVRFRAPDGEPGRSTHNDLIRGKVEQLDNRNDAVILKSSTLSPRLPTYHFAHVVDDHLMRVSLVTRGEEWIPSLPLHLQLFDALGFEPPAFAHIAPLMKLAGNSKRKLSKRKDPEASVESYINEGYPEAAVRIYLRGLANSNLQDAPFDEALETPLQLDRMGVAGPVFDLDKLESIARNYVAGMEPADRVAAIKIWAATYDAELAALLETEGERLLRAFELERAIDRNPRKDVAKWSDVLAQYAVFLPSRFMPTTDPAHAEFRVGNPDLVRAVIADYAEGYDHAEDRDAWFERVRELAVRHGFAAKMGDYKRDPDAYAGSIADASNIIRIAMTGQARSPDLYLISQVVGEDEVRRRLAPLAAER